MKQYDLDLPAHLLTEQVQTDIYNQASSGVVDYGQLSPITELIMQFQNQMKELADEKPDIAVSDDDEFSTQFKKLLEIAGDDHDLKRAVVRVGKAHTMATVVYDKATDSKGITQSMWLWRYINDVSMLMERLNENTQR